MESKGKWRVHKHDFDDTPRFIAGRTINVTEAAHGGNIEYCGKYVLNKIAAQNLCDKLNELIK